MVAAGVWWRTLRHLKWEQIFGRLVFKLHAARPDVRAAPALRAASGSWEAALFREQSFWPPNRWRFLNVERNADLSGWSSAGADRLWLYNLHYFDDLNARDAVQRTESHRALVARWIAANRPGHGTGWEPYPVSLRVVNWVKWFLGGEPPNQQSLDSLATQIRWLRSRLEVHLLGNHLFANAKALVFGGAFFSGSEAENWLSAGIRIIDRELEEQILDDGGHFERSPMYHALILEDLLDLLNLSNAYGTGVPPLAGLQARLRAKIKLMIRWLDTMVDASGHLTRFNDCADGVAPSRDDLRVYARRLDAEPSVDQPVAVAVLEPSGYVRVTRGRMTAWLDVARLGPDYLPGHAHADTLSFEFSVDGDRVLMNGGTSCYGVGERRAYERSTFAHNTVVVAGQNSSEVWAGFRVGRRANPRNLVVREDDIQCSHDGYRFLPQKPLVTRRWRFGDADIVVEDTVAPAASAVAHFYLAPGLRAEQDDDRRWVVKRASTVVVRVAVEVGHAAVERRMQAQAFGVVSEVDCLAVTLRAGSARTLWSWA